MIHTKAIVSQYYNVTGIMMGEDEDVTLDNLSLDHLADGILLSPEGAVDHFVENVRILQDDDDEKKAKLKDQWSAAIAEDRELCTIAADLFSKVVESE